MSVLEQLRKLDEQRSQLLDKAKAEAKTKAEDAVRELNDLGFAYRLVEGTGDTKGKKQTRQRDPNKPCGICGYVTDPPHDGRAHKNRSQKAFTGKELEELGFKKRT